MFKFEIIENKSAFNKGGKIKAFVTKPGQDAHEIRELNLKQFVHLLLRINAALRSQHELVTTPPPTAPKSVPPKRPPRLVMDQSTAASSPPLRQSSPATFTPVRPAGEVEIWSRAAPPSPPASPSASLAPAPEPTPPLLEASASPSPSRPAVPESVVATVAIDHNSATLAIPVEVSEIYFPDAIVIDESQQPCLASDPPSNPPEMPTASDGEEEGESDEDLENNCAICMEGELERVLPCGHAFCAVCIESWNSTKNTCPLCRQVATVDDSWEISDVPTADEMCQFIVDLIQMA